MSRFKDISEDDLALLMEKRDSLNTKNVIKGALNIFESYCTEKSIVVDASDTDDLNRRLTKFYAAVRTKSGDLYSKKSMLSIRYGLQKHFESTAEIDIVNSPQFKGANQTFQAMLVKLKKEGKAEILHKSPLSKEDLTKLYNSFDLDTPQGLQDKVFVDFMLFFCNRGRENLREIKKSDFIFDENDNYIQLRDMATKNHRGYIEDSESQGGRIYKTNTKVCPYASFMRYLSLLNPKCDFFFQRPKSKSDTVPWYDNMPLGKHKLGDKMKDLSEELKLSRKYTNHCLRATSITLLDGFEARHVMTVSGHKSETSIRSYARTSDEQKQKMALKIGEAVSGDSVNCSGPSEPEVQDSWDMSLSDIDLLELTNSQEQMLLMDIQNLRKDDQHSEALQIGANKTITSATTCVGRRAPIYQFSNCTVNFYQN